MILAEISGFFVKKSKVLAFGRMGREKRVIIKLNKGGYMKEELKNIVLMGLGAMALTTDKAKELREELLEKGTKLYQEGKVANEELKHNIEQKIKESVTVVVEEKDITKEDIMKAVQMMNEEEKEELMNWLGKKEKNKKKDE